MMVYCSTNDFFLKVVKDCFFQQREQAETPIDDIQGKQKIQIEIKLSYKMLSSLYTIKPTKSCVKSGEKDKFDEELMIATSKTM